MIRPGFVLSALFFFATIWVGCTEIDPSTTSASVGTQPSTPVSIKTPDQIPDQTPEQTPEQVPEQIPDRIELNTPDPVDDLTPASTPISNTPLPLAPTPLSPPGTINIEDIPEEGRITALSPLAPFIVSPGPDEESGDTLSLIGRGERLLPLGTTDVWVLNDHAYLGTGGTLCGDGTGENGSGVRIFDVSDPRNPLGVAFVPSVLGSSINDVKAATLDTPLFNGDLLVHSNEACDDGPGGIEIYDVTNPHRPVHLASVRMDELNEVSDFISGGSTNAGVHNLFIFTQKDRAYVAVYAETVFGNFRIYEITNPEKPSLVSTWGAEELFDPGVSGLTFKDVSDGYDRVFGAVEWLKSGFGDWTSRFMHDVTVNDAGDRAYLSNWDAGLVLLDISDPASPTLISVADPTIGPSGEGNSHSAWPNEDGSIVVESTEYFVNSKLGMTISAGPLAGAVIAGTEAGGSSPPPFSETGEVKGELVFVGRGCPDGEPPEGVPGGDSLLDDPEGKIAVIRRGECTFASKILRAQAAGAVAVVIANNALDGPAVGWNGSDPSIEVPALMISTGNGDAIEASPIGNVATIDPTIFTDLKPWGFVRIWDYTDPKSPVLASTFNTTNSLNEHGPPDNRGIYSVHNVMTEGNQVFISGYSNGVLVLDISDPHNPVEIARYNPTSAEFEESNGGIQQVFGIYKPRGQNVVYASDRNGGLYLLQLGEGVSK